MRTLGVVLCLWSILFLAACGGGADFIDAAAIDGRQSTDAAVSDGPTTDAAAIDATAIDAAAIDATAIDAAAADALAIDAAAADAASSDALAIDAPTTDGGAGGVPDPAPGIDTPGEHGGAGCPDGNQSNFSLPIGAASTYTFSGQITGAVGDGVFWVQGPGGETVGGAIETAGDGSYAKTLPIFCGANLVKLVWNNGTCPLVLVYAVDRTTCITADITVTLQWDDAGRDWELHLVKPGGRINDPATDCTWDTCISTSPDWGVVGDPADDPHKDIDNTSAFGPENIWLAGPEAGRYTVLVEHWGAGTPSDGFVTLNVGGQVVTVNVQDLASHFVWTAATIDWPAGTITPSSSIFDCTTNWLSGCNAVLP